MRKLPNKNGVQKLVGINVAQAYVDRFEAAVKNFEMLIEEENHKRNTAIKQRFANFF